jgi:magnesium-transporting ATPase (P-type)
VLEPVQILWINLLDSVLLTLPLMMERKENGLLKTEPRHPNSQIINKLFLERIVLIGLAISLPGFYIYAHFGSAEISPDGSIDTLLLTQAQTAAFWAVLFAHIGYVISARSVYTSFFRINPFSNPWLLAGIAGSLIIRIIPTVWPQAAVLFRTAEFPVEWWPTILLCILPCFVCIELDKLVRNIFSGDKPKAGQHRVKHV